MKIQGFSLIELLVVLVLMGMVTALAGPRLQNLYNSALTATERQTVQAEIDQLGYRAWLEGNPLILSSYPDETAKFLPLNLPSGWQLQTSAPIRYTSLGATTGGVIMVVSPTAQKFRLEVLAPHGRTVWHIESESTEK